MVYRPTTRGERTPHPDPLARGAFIGLTLRHSRAHMTRAVLEGVAFGLKDSFTLIQNAGSGKIAQVRASGGGTKGLLWRQILASVLNAELVTVNTTESVAYGAALLAGVGAGKWGSVAEACQMCIKVMGPVHAAPADVEGYRKSYVLFQALYPALQESFRRLGADY